MMPTRPDHSSQAPILLCLRCGHEASGAPASCPICGGELHAAGGVDPLIGQLFGEQYRIDARIGEGGMGRVYRATHIELGSTVVIKVLHPRWADDAECVRRFFREARTTASLRHPANVRTLDFARRPDGLIYMVMEHVDGPTLADRQLPLSPADAVSLIADVAAGLGEAHALNLVHRDLKPENIIIQRVNDRDFARVLDYGIARSIDSDTALTTDGALLGTPAYMSPEQAAGLPVDARSDIYALGVILYQLLSGQRPFEGAAPVVLEAHRYQSPTPLSEHVAIDEPLEEIVESCLAKNRDVRPADGATLHAILTELLPSLSEHRSAAAASPTMKQPTVTQDTAATATAGVTTHGSPRRAMAIIAMLVLALITGLVGTIVGVPAFLHEGDQPSIVSPSQPVDDESAANPTDDEPPCTPDTCANADCALQSVCAGADLTPLLPQQAFSQQGFGARVALDGDQLVIGSSGRSNHVVYAHRDERGRWLAESVPSPRTDGHDRFGSAVAVRGDLLAVGASWDTTLLSQTGAVYVYRRLDEAWTLVSRLDAPDPDEGLHFGFSVAIDEQQRVIVSALRAHPFPTDTIWVFDCATEGCPLTGTLSAPADDMVRGFGNALDASDDRIIVGALSNRMWDEGQAYIYEHAAPLDGQWRLAQTLVLPERTTAQYFGCTVGISGEWAVVSACPNGGHPNVATVVAYHRQPDGQWLTDTTWTEYDLDVSEPAVLYADISYPYLAIGSNEGRVLHYTHTPQSGWELTTTIRGPARAGKFGYSLAADGPHLLVGAEAESGEVAMSGAAYVVDSAR